MKTIEIFEKEDMIDFALYYWRNEEGKTATYDGAVRHFKNYIKGKQNQNK